jgi:hypothetical protein
MLITAEDRRARGFLFMDVIGRKDEDSLAFEGLAAEGLGISPTSLSLNPPSDFMLTASFGLVGFASSIAGRSLSLILSSMASNEDSVMLCEPAGAKFKTVAVR